MKKQGVDINKPIPIIEEKPEEPEVKPEFKKFWKLEKRNYRENNLKVSDENLTLEKINKDEYKMAFGSK